MQCKSQIALLGMLGKSDLIHLLSVSFKSHLGLKGTGYDKKANYDIKVSGVEIIPFPISKGKETTFSIVASSGASEEEESSGGGSENDEESRDSEGEEDSEELGGDETGDSNNEDSEDGEDNSDDSDGEGGMHSEPGLNGDNDEVASDGLANREDEHVASADGKYIFGGNLDFTSYNTCWKWMVKC
ncbi:Hypothetical predicted protein [Olea europaea subsp. europaea]|uniref:Uncharacterized protein n=1 Tax=Olea europaea subsp. europaea TaxID=158383 RepID=A0A8S0PUG6_OLEEU|nr:Hypothetical predicted protein [Olea europaea subsp. europaea]